MPPGPTAASDRGDLRVRDEPRIRIVIADDQELRPDGVPDDPRGRTRHGGGGRSLGR